MCQALSTLQTTRCTKLTCLLRSFNHIFLFQHSICSRLLSIFRPAWGRGGVSRNACQGTTIGRIGELSLCQMNHWNSSEPPDAERSQTGRSPSLISFVDRCEEQLFFAILPCCLWISQYGKTSSCTALYLL